MSKALSFLSPAVLTLALTPSGLAGQEAETGHHVTPDAVAFEPFPAERDAQIAILHGDPSEAGHYILRLKFAPNWNGRPHRHGGDELITIQSGTCFIAHGDDLTRDAAAELPAGSFARIPAGTPMRGFSGDEGCVADVQGHGPFTTEYLDETEDDGQD